MSEVSNACVTGENGKHDFVSELKSGKLNGKMTNYLVCQNPECGFEKHIPIQ